jgi:hypothetical protein
MFDLHRINLLSSTQMDNRILVIFEGSLFWKSEDFPVAIKPYSKAHTGLVSVSIPETKSEALRRFYALTEGGLSEYQTETTREKSTQHSQSPCRGNKTG